MKSTPGNMTEYGKISALLEAARSDRDLVDQVRSHRKEIEADLRARGCSDVRLKDGRLFRIVGKPKSQK